MTSPDIALGGGRALRGWRGWLDPLRAGLGAAHGFVERRLDAERDHLSLWLVVGLGCGIALYFSMPFEPAPGLTAGALALSLSGWALARRLARPAGLMAGFVLAAAIGLSCADLRAALVAAPVLPREIGPAELEGRVLSRNIAADGSGQIILKVTRIGRLPEDQWPRKARVTLRKGLDIAAPGAHIHLLAKLMPPSGPAAPGAYDFARKAYFQGVGAVGFAFGGPELLKAAPVNGLIEQVGRWRENVARTVSAAIPGPSGGIAVALATGLRGAVPVETEDELRAAGLSHLLSISGLHISIVALALFGAIRLMLACSEFVTLRFPIKKWAAGAAILGVCAYTQVTGASIPAERSFIMCALVLLGVILDRRAITLRNVALAGGMVLLVLPENLLDVSFQMSFAATLALISAFEYWNKRRALRPRPPQGAWLWSGIDYIRGLTMTSLVAGIATAPFSAFHFQTISSYGLLSNMIAVPLTGVLVMPALLLVYVLLPLGLAGPALFVAGLGLDGVLATAHFVAGLPGAVLDIRAGSMEALVLIALGGLWLCLWQTGWRIYGLAAIGIGLCVWTAMRPPDLLIARDLKTIALRDASGALVIAQGKAVSFEAEIWTRRAGQGEERLAFHAAKACDAAGCSYVLRDGTRVALSRSPASLDDDCAAAQILITTGRMRRKCSGPALIIDRVTAARHGAIAIWSAGEKLVMKGAGGELEGRPWSPKRPPPRDAKTALHF